MENTNRFFNWLKRTMSLEKSINTFGRDDDEKHDHPHLDVDEKKDGLEPPCIDYADHSDDKKEDLSEFIRVGLIPPNYRILFPIKNRLSSENMSLGLFLAIRRVYIFNESVQESSEKSKVSTVTIYRIERNKGTTHERLNMYMEYLKLDKDFVKNVFLNDYINMTCRVKKNVNPS